MPLPSNWQVCILFCRLARRPLRINLYFFLAYLFKPLFVYFLIYVLVSPIAVNNPTYSHYVSSPNHSPRHNPNNRSIGLITQFECIRLLFFHYSNAYHNSLAISDFQEMPCLWGLSALFTLGTGEQTNALNVKSIRKHINTFYTINIITEI